MNAKPANKLRPGDEVKLSGNVIGRIWLSGKVSSRAAVQFEGLWALGWYAVDGKFANRRDFDFVKPTDRIQTP